MELALDLWPTLFVGLWAYPFAAIAHMRHRRLMMDLADIGTGVRHATLADAYAAIRDFQARMQAEIEAEKAAAIPSPVVPTLAQGDET